MEKGNLTEVVIKKVKHKPKQFKLSDGGGLYLLVHPNGSKYWRFDFRFGGKQKSSSLGVWPDVTLAEARKIRNSAKKKINEGVNPIDERRNKKSFQRSNNDLEESKETFDLNKSSAILQRGGEKKSSLLSRGNDQIVLNEIILNVFPEYGEKEFSELEKEDLAKMLKNIVENRKKIFRILWELYPSFPVLQLCVLFVLLFFVTDLFSSFFTTILYFLLSVGVTIFYDWWDKKNS